jgi:hypothetical protein
MRRAAESWFSGLIDFQHAPVIVEEVIESWDPSKRDGNAELPLFVDGSGTCER